MTDPASNLPHIRNFSIIAHIDHGKSTLADRLLQATNAVSPREAREQILDSMDLERERGITIKASAVTVWHRHKLGATADDLETEYEETIDDSGAQGAAPDAHKTRKGAGAAEEHGELFMLNFIDTPGHVDFNYEVSRALKACEGAILVVDATQGVQAQTVVNAYLAINEDLVIVPVINKIDLPSARPDDMAMEVEQVLGIPAEDCIYVSAKTGQGIKQLLAAICEKFPPPRKAIVPQTRALIFDAKYDDYRGVIVYVRVMDGKGPEQGGALKVGDKIRMMGTGRSFQITELGKYTPKPVRVPTLSPGETGYVVAAIRSLKDVRIGDTVTLDIDPATEALPGYKPPVQMVYCDFYPATSTGEDDGPAVGAKSKNDFESLRIAMEKLSLNDSSFTFMPVHSDALGFGFRCGFLGLLHMDIIQERLEREGGVEVIQTAPTVSYQVMIRGDAGQAMKKTNKGGIPPTIIAAGGQPIPGAVPAGAAADGPKKIEKVPDGKTLIEVHNPADLPDPSYIEDIREPICKVDIILPKQYIGDIMKLCLDRRGLYKQQSFISNDREMLTFELPLAEIIYDFYDKLKGITSGYGTMDYELIGFKPDDLVKMDILVNGDPVEALSIIVHRDKAEYRGRLLVGKLREQIPRHQFEIPVQAAIGSKVIARETIKAFRKNVTAKCYGGDVSRKRKLLEKQKEGKKRMKAIGSVEIPQEAFMAVLEQGE
ncbi:MAG TPA: GTP-binding protein [Phycisphaerales bacterium]|jgi:GTP-binding protein LepA|nr:GTP-binding protein [Phycisphaerales bacterium]